MAGLLCTDRLVICSRDFEIIVAIYLDKTIFFYSGESSWNMIIDSLALIIRQFNFSKLYNTKKVWYHTSRVWYPVRLRYINMVYECTSLFSNTCWFIDQSASILSVHSLMSVFRMSRLKSPCMIIGVLILEDTRAMEKHLRTVN